MGRQLAIKQSGAYKRAKTLHIKQDGAFVRARNAYIKQAGTWKPFLTPFNEWVSIPGLLEVNMFSAFANETTISTFVPGAGSARMRNLDIISGTVTESEAPALAGLTGSISPWSYSHFASAWEENVVVFTHTTSFPNPGILVQSALYDISADTVTTLPNMSVPALSGGTAWITRPGWAYAYFIVIGFNTPIDSRRFYIYKVDKTSHTSSLVYTDMFGFFDVDVPWRMRWTAGADGNIYGLFQGDKIKKFDTTTETMSDVVTVAGYDATQQILVPVWLGEETELSYMRVGYVVPTGVPLSTITAEFKQYDSVGMIWEDRAPFNFGYNPVVASPEQFFSGTVSPYSALLAANYLTDTLGDAGRSATLHLFYGD